SAHITGQGHRLDNGVFRNSGDIKFLPLDGHHLTAATYVYYYLDSYKKWGFPQNEYLERIVDKINRIRRDMAPETRGVLEALENKSERPVGLSQRYNEISDDSVPEDQETVFKNFVAALDKLNAFLRSKDA